METFKVPIRNLFCMLSYMNDMPQLIESLNDVDEDLITYDFIAKQFLIEVEKLHNKGLVKDYVSYANQTSRLGGRLLIEQSLPYLLARKPVVVCEKDEYSPNIAFNQIMKSTLLVLCNNRQIKETTRKESYKFIEKMPEVESIELTKGLFKRIYFARHTKHYKRMIHIALLLHELTLLSHKHGDWSLFNATLDEKEFNHLFEKFLFHFYRLEQKEYKVSSETMRWKLEGNQGYLPTMKTDISLTHRKEKKKIIIDAKFYKNMFQQNYNKASFHSHNMYQLFTYLMHQDKELDLRGILIYPDNGVEVAEKYRWSEKVMMEVFTVDLNSSWGEIYGRLKGILESHS